jgi:uncharacterized protein (DUF1697 family)
MAEKKSILEEALLDVKNIQSALNANTKEILRSVAREEIDSVVKESLIKEIYEEEDLESTDGPVELGGDADAASADVMGDLDGAELEDDDLGDIETSDEVGPEMGSELGMDSDELGGVAMDMTAASDDDVIAIYKKLSGEDEIEIVGDEIHMNITEPGQYIVKTNNTPLGGAMGTDDMDVDMGVDMGDELGAGDDTDYEIEMGGDEEGVEADMTDLVAADGEDEEGVEADMTDLVPADGEEEEVEIDEAIRKTEAEGRKVGAKYQPKVLGAKRLEESASKKLVLETKKKYNGLLAEATKLKAENEEFRKALKVFRTQLVETVVFNSNLTYTTRLFMEHSTTKAEKHNIIKRFDNEVSNLVESKKLYKAIASELETRKPIKESVENKLIKEVSTGASKQLNESTAYVDPSTKRILDLINRTK